jgi:membrane protein DedA with SNARE-associated domain
VKELVQFLTEHGYAVLFVWVLAEQLGLPIPATPILMAAGALVGQGKLNWALTLAAPILGVAIADNCWFEFGRTHGAKVLRLLCRISLEPDSCVRRTENVFHKYGIRTLLAAKFIPGLNAAAAPVMGISGLKREKFVFYDTIGALLWTGTFVGLGFIFSDELEAAANLAARFGGWLLVVLAGALAAFIIFKWRERQRFLKSLVADRIEPEELKAKMEAGQPVVVVDLRHQLDSLFDPRTIPGALRMAPEELQARHEEIPRDAEIILYCT